MGKIFGVAFDEQDNVCDWYWDFNDINYYGPALFIIDTKGVVQYEWFW